MSVTRTKEYMTHQFNKYKGMVLRKSMQVAKSYGLDYDEVCSDGYLLFVEALMKYDETRGAFSTYLYWRLQGIADLYFRSNKDVVHFDYQPDVVVEDSAPLFDVFVKQLDLQSSIETELSEKAQLILAYIFANKDKRHTCNSIMQHFRQEYLWTVGVVERTLREIRGWWAGYQIC